MKNTTAKRVYLSIEQFDKELEDNLTITITKEPTRRNPYYVCQYLNAELSKSIIHVNIIKKYGN